MDKRSTHSAPGQVCIASASVVCHFELFGVGMLRHNDLDTMTGILFFSIENPNYQSHNLIAVRYSSMFACKHRGSLTFSRGAMSLNKYPGVGVFSRFVAL